MENHPIYISDSSRNPKARHPWSYLFITVVSLVLTGLTLRPTLLHTSSGTRTLSTAPQTAPRHFSHAGNSRLTAAGDSDYEFSDKISKLPGVRRLDDSNLLEGLLRRKVEDIRKALGPQVITPTVGDMEPDPVVPAFVLAIAEKIPRKSSEWLMIGAAVFGSILLGYLLRTLVGVLKYRWQAAHIQRAVALLDAAHARDPVLHIGSGRPRELVFVARATTWLKLLYPEASPELQLAVRAHKLESWKPRREQRRVGEYLKLAGLSSFIAPVTLILERRGAPADPAAVAFEDCVTLTTIDGLLEAQAAGMGVESDAFAALFDKEWRLLSPKAQALARQRLIAPLPAHLQAELRPTLSAAPVPPAPAFA